MPVKNCPNCGKSFSTPPSRDYNTCSRECRKALRLKQHERVCVSCGKTFSDPKHPDKTHCSAACAGIGVRPPTEHVCATCGQAFMSWGKRRYCSNACYRSKPKPVLTPGRELRSCLHCGVEYVAWINRATQFCSRTCHGAYQSTMHPKVDRICEVCGKPYQVGRFFVEKRRSRFCSIECQSASASITKRGAGNVNYRGGSVEYRGANWRRQSRLARIRDGYRCQLCHKKIGLKRHDHGVHHIKPYRKFEGDWETANQLSNLITLCSSCHMGVEFGNKACPQRLL